MAIITTRATMGWYGIEGHNCSSLSLPAFIGTYNASGNFVQGSSGLTESQASKLGFYTLSSSMDVWRLDLERDFRNNPATVGIISLDTLECGRMYWIDKDTDAEFVIPQWVPGVYGVDTGRVVQ